MYYFVLSENADIECSDIQPFFVDGEIFMNNIRGLTLHLFLTDHLKWALNRTRTKPAYMLGAELMREHSEALGFLVVMHIKSSFER